MTNESDDYMLSTVDNPFNPFTQWDQWYAYDRAMGYETCALLARIAIVSDDLSEADQSRAIDVAVDSILENDPFDLWIKVTRKDFVTGGES